MNLTSAIRGISGEPELIRSLGALGILLYALGGIGFQAWNMARGVPFDVVAFCTAYPAGLVAAYVGVANATSIKDRGVAKAQEIASGTPAEPAS